MSRIVNVGAAQMGPIAADESRAEVVGRLIALLRDGAEAGCDLVVFPELALTTFFPGGSPKTSPVTITTTSVRCRTLMFSRSLMKLHDLGWFLSRLRRTHPR